MNVRTLIIHLLDTELDAEVSCININDPHDEFAETSDKTASLQSIADNGDAGVSLYYLGDRQKPEED